MIPTLFRLCDCAWLPVGGSLSCRTGSNINCVNAVVKRCIVVTNLNVTQLSVMTNYNEALLRIIVVNA